MRQLRIVGVDASASTVECELSDSGEKVTLPLDDRLRAAARGEAPADAGRSAPATVTGSMRPRDIQDRIRHGADPEQVAAEAGVPLSRIEGFAYPVLLERSSAAERARSAHPVLPDGPAVETLAERLADVLAGRGVEEDLIRWDAWRTRAGGWVVRTSWPMGLSDDVSATWAYTPDSHGGAARPLDEEAETILDPSRAAEPRAVPAPSGVPASGATGTGDPAESPEPAALTAPPVRSVPTPPEPASLGAGDADRARPVPSVERTSPPSPAVSTPLASAPVPVAPPETPAATGDREDSPAARTHETPAEPSRRDASGGTHPEDDTDEFLRHPPAEPEPDRRPSSRRHPTMPSWEDVLLGVRGKDE